MVAEESLQLVSGFVNTVDDATLRTWLRRRGGTKRMNLRNAAALREAIRDLISNGPDVLSETERQLSAAANRAELHLTFDDPGGLRLKPRAGGMDRLLGEVLVAIAEATVVERWHLLKLCSNEACGVAFVGGPSKWCGRSDCANRNKAATR
jgi:predicted RNA-binding Zn ribbon-like protein